MIRRAIVMILCLMASALGIGLFLVKHEVKSQESYLAQLNRDILRGQEAIHVLNAEWSYLNDPVRLRVLAEKHLGLTVVKPTQIATLDTLGGKLRGDIPSAPSVMIAKAPTPAVQPGERTQVANAQTVNVMQGMAAAIPVALNGALRATPKPQDSAVASVGSDDVAPRRVVPSRAYTAPSSYTPSYAPPSYAAVPAPSVNTPPAAAAKRRVIVVPSPALARASTYGGSP